MRYLLCVVLIIVSTPGWAQSPDPASAAGKVSKPTIPCEGKVLILRSGAWTCETVTGGTGQGTTYSFQPPMSESAGTVTIDLSGYATTSALTTGLAGKADSSHTQAISTITNLQTTLDGKQAAGSYAAANATMTVNTVSCALGGSCTITDGTKVPTTRTVAGKALSSNITIACSDLSDDGDACSKSVGTTAGTVAAGDDSRITGALQANGASLTDGTLTLPGTTGGDILIPDGGTAAANHLTSAATSILMWGTLPVAVGQGGEVTTGSVAGSSSAAVTLTWGTAFPGTTYKVNCNVIEATTSGSTLRVHHIESKSTTAVVVRVINDDSSAHTGTLSCLALN